MVTLRNSCRQYFLLDICFWRSKIEKFRWSARIIFTSLIVIFTKLLLEFENAVFLTFIDIHFAWSIRVNIFFEFSSHKFVLKILLTICRLCSTFYFIKKLWIILHGDLNKIIISNYEFDIIEKNKLFLEVLEETFVIYRTHESWK